MFVITRDMGCHDSGFARDGESKSFAFMTDPLVKYLQIDFVEGCHVGEDELSLVYGRHRDQFLTNRMAVRMALFGRQSPAGIEATAALRFFCGHGESSFRK